MLVLVACESSGVVREAFRSRGHEAWSCDLLPADDGSEFHIQGDVFSVLHEGWDLVIAHPPCTHLASSGARWFAQKAADGRQQDGIRLFLGIRDRCQQIGSRFAIENPVGIMSRLWRKPDQIVQPWMFGHGETKATCLWLGGVKALVPTNIVDGREPRIHRLPPTSDRWKIRSRTYQGIADAMAEQWGS
jgi:hypothetical protein